MGSLDFVSSTFRTIPRATAFIVRVSLAHEAGWGNTVNFLNRIEAPPWVGQGIHRGQEKHQTPKYPNTEHRTFNIEHRMHGCIALVETVALSEEVPQR